MASDATGPLNEQLAELRSRVQALEAALHAYGIVLPTEPKTPHHDLAPTPLPPTDVQATPPLIPQLPAPPAPPPQAATAPPLPPFMPQPAPDHSLESRIGSQWFNRIGILAVLIGMSWFLKLAIDNHWIGELGRVLIGLAAGAGLIAWSERFHRRGYPAFGYSLKAVGSGILYLSLWAAFSLFHLIPSSAAFAAMIAVTAFNGFMSWVQDAELLALYSIVGGLSTPLLLSTGVNHEVSLFTYLLVLDLAVLVLVALKPWSRLLFGAFLGTTLFFTGWYFSYYSQAQFGRTVFFLLGFFLVFALGPRLIRLRAEDHTTRWDGLALAAMPVANAGLTFLALYAIFDQFNRTTAAPWLAVGFAAFYLLLLRLPARAPLRAASEVLSMLHLTTAIVFLTLALPLKTHGRWLTIGWQLQALALLWVSRRVGSRLLAVLGLLCLALGLGALLLIHPPASTIPLLNQRFGAYAVSIAIFAAIAWLARNPPPATPGEGAFDWPALAVGSALVVNLLILLAVSQEIHNYWWFVRWHGAWAPNQWALLQDYRMYAQFTYSAFFMLFGAILLALGFLRSSALLRWQALLLLAVAIGKVFTVDVSELSQGYRVLSFLGLGALLLAVSFVYQRDWLHLRGEQGRRA
ncbi:MAG TPA: DUF2339 domain-containing protein [Acidobacteriaceae bacterium]